MGDRAVTIQMQMQVKGLNGTRELLRAIPKRIALHRNGPVRGALKVGAYFLRDKAKANLRRSIEIRGEESTGFTESVVVVSPAKNSASREGVRYLVRVKKASFVNANGERTQAQMTANLLEYGSAHQPATPWLRPALYQHGGETVNIITAELNARLAEMVEALAADYRSKG